MQERRSNSNGNSQSGRRHRPDYLLVLISIALLLIGLVVVYSISPGISVQKKVSENYYISKQLLAIGLGLAAFLVTANMPVLVWRRIEKPMIVVATIATVMVRLFGQQVNGAYRWIQIGGISFQAAELIKFVLLIWLAGFLADRVKNRQLDIFNKSLKPVLIVLAIIALVVAGLESDLGSMTVMVVMMGAMIFVVGMPLKRIFLVCGLVLIGVVILISGSSYRRQRLTTFLNPTSDCNNTGYQACEALISVGSGGMFGLGLGRSVQAYGYLPEAANDSIFAIFAEKFGFFGVAVLLAMFCALFTRLKNIMERTRDIYSRLLIVGILAWLSTQTIINIGAMIGLLPLKGITLPFISYGGTSLVFVTAAIGLAFNISRYTSFGSVTDTQDMKGGAQDDYRYTQRRRLRGAHYPSLSGR